MKKSNYKRKSFKINRLFLTGFIFFTFQIAIVYGQNVSPAELYKITQVPPEAASLGKYGEYPVGLYSGVPDISIPFYEIKSGRISLPLGISYNASGIKVEEIASSVGLAWSLNSGGVITRATMGLPDDQINLDGRNFLNTPFTVDSLLALLPDSYQANFIYNHLKQIIAAKIDGEPDIYYYNFGKYSGKFLYDQKDHKFYSAPASAMRIVYNDHPGDSYFTITDPDGIVYTFKDAETNRRETGETAPPEIDVTTSWFLTSIDDPVSKHSIAFEYQDYTLNYYTISSEVDYMPYAPARNKVTIASKQNPVYYLKRLKKITFDSGYVEFGHELSRCDLPGDYALTSVKIYDNNHTLFKHFSLNYDYYFSDSFHTLNCADKDESVFKRLKLVEVDENPVDNSGSAPKSYKMEYNQLPLPSRLSKAQDHWGYYNGRDDNQYLYPKYLFYQNSIPVWLEGGDRDINSTYSAAGIINKITYPAGGYTLFEFENNVAKSEALPSTNADYQIQWFGGDGETLSELPFTIGSAACEINNSNNPGAWVSLDISGLRTDLLAQMHFPGPAFQVRYVNTSNSAGDICFQLGGDKDVGSIGNMPVVFYLPNGDYNLIVDCSSNSAPETYEEAHVRLSWSECPPTTDISGNNRLAGGLRIKRIASYSDPEKQPVVKRYKYVKNHGSAESSGETHFYPQYFHNVAYSANLESELNRGPYYLKRYSQSNYPLCNENGKSVGYSSVLEYDGDEDANGYTQYTYTNYSEYDDVVNITYPNSLPESFQWLRGLELSRRSFKKQDSEYKLVSETLNEYDTNLLGPNKKVIKGIRGVFIYHEVVSETPGDEALYLGPIEPGWELHPVHSDFVYLKRSRQRIYSGSDFTEQVTDYTYNPRNFLPSVIKTIDSKADTLISNVKYPLDFSVDNAVSNPARSIRNLQELNYISAHIEEYDQQSMTGEDRKLLRAKYLSFLPELPLVDTIFTMTRPNTPVLNYPGILINSGTYSRPSFYDPDVIVTKYDVNFNSLLEQKEYKGASHSYLWDANGNYVLAEAGNARYDDIAYDSFEDNSTGNWSISGGTITQAGDTFLPAGGKKYFALNASASLSKAVSAGKTYILSYWSQSSVPLSVSGGSESHQLLKTVNGWNLHEHKIMTSGTTLAITGTGNIDEIRLRPADAMLSTFGIKSLTGMVSQTDTKNETTYYLYDSFQRLLQARDQNGKVLKQYNYNYKE